MKTTELSLLVSLVFVTMLLALWGLNQQPDALPDSGFARGAAYESAAPSTSLPPEKSMPARRPFKSVSTTKRPLIAPLDVRDHEKRTSPAAAERTSALDTLQRDVPGVKVTFDRLSDAPSRIIAVGRPLTPPAPDLAPKQIVASFIDRYPALFGHSSETLEKQARVTMDDATSHSGLKSLVWEQEIQGVRLFRTNFIANLGKEGDLLSLSSRFLSNPVPNSQSPALQVNEAIILAASTLGDTLTVAQIKPTGQAEGTERRQTFQAEGLSDTLALLTYLPMNERQVRLGWDVTLTSVARNEMFRLVVDAVSGDILFRTSLTNTISNATYNVYADSVTKQPFHSPSPMHPTHQTPLTTQPPLVARQSVTLSALDTTASPNGWVADGANPETIGNNVAAHADVDANNSPDLPRPNGGATRNFNFPLDLNLAPSTYRSASIVNLFYVNNWLHDRLYGLGFTETSRNFQTSNFSRGGAQNDAVQADAQDGSGFNNANFSTPADGSPGRMQMFLFTPTTPDRDSALDHQTIVHEYVHGLSNRLVGGGALISAIVTRGMGEGWSDFYSIALLAQAIDNPDDTFCFGGYLEYLFNNIETNYYSGVRRYPYSPDKAKNPLTLLDTSFGKARLHDGIFFNKMFFNFSDQNPSEVHNMGEVWCSALLEIRRLLIQKHGFTSGNELALQLVTDGMKLCPADPTFLEARDAIVQADLNASSGANSKEIWAGFAKRGFGLSAENPENFNTLEVEEAFDTPGDMTVTPVIAFEVNANAGASTASKGTRSYVLKNNGTTALSWTAAATQTWTTVKPTSGTLAAGRTVTLTWALNAAINTLPAGEKHDTLTITDTATGATQARPLIFNVNAKPVILNQLADTLRAQYTLPNQEFSVDYIGSERMQFQWFKNGKLISGNNSGITLGQPSTGNAGFYKVKLTNAAGTATSAQAQLAVVVARAQTIPTTDGSTLTIPLQYVGKGLTFQWSRNGTDLANGSLDGRVSGATSPTLSIKKFTAADVAAGNDFRCKVKLGTQEVTTEAQTVLIRDKPVIVAVSPPRTLMTSDSISWDISSLITQTNNQFQHLPTSYTIRGLPLGLTYDRTTGRISGSAKVTGLTEIRLTITATNGTGTSSPLTVVLPFQSLPPLTYGEFRGLVNRDGTADDNLGASFQVNISSIGSLTGSLRMGTRSYTLTGRNYDSSLTSNFFSATASFPGGDRDPIYLLLDIDRTTGNATGRMNGFFKKGTSLLYYDPSLTARRIPWQKPGNLATAYSGPYTAALQSSGLTEPSNPLGHGIITSTIDTLGNVTASIRLADGTLGTCATKVSDSGQIPLYLGAYRSTGSLHGYTLITNSTGFWDNASTSLTYRKAPQATGSTRSYVGGITQHNLTLTGGRWVAPQSPLLLLGVNDVGADNARITFSNAFINTSQLAPGGTFTTPFRIRSSPASSILLPTPKPGALSLTVTLKSGLFTGSFSTVDDNPLITGTQNISRKAPYAGAFVQRLNQGLGHFNLPRLPHSGQASPAKTAILSGKVVIITSP
jgi:hypothetical protein